MKELTEASNAHVALGVGEDLLQKIFSYSNDGIFVIDPERDEILEVNPKACSMLGYLRDELLSLPISAVHPDEMPRLLSFAKSVLERGHGWTNELSCLTKTGKKLPAEISASVVEMAGKKCMIAMVRDISDRKRAEEALLQHSANLERLVEERTTQFRRSEERQRVLLEINNAIIANLDRKALFHAITQALRKFVYFDAAALCLHDPQKSVWRLFAFETPSLPSYPFEVGTELDLQETHVGWVI